MRLAGLGAALRATAPFNSLFEMLPFVEEFRRRRKAQVAFNSLFEMLLLFSTCQPLH